MINTNFKRIISIIAFIFFNSINVVAFDNQDKEKKEDIIGAITNRTERTKLDVQLPVVKYTLKNGLTVLLLEDHSVPMISYHTWYRVGSRNEEPGVTGAAHMLEHMMFKGANKYDGKSFDRILHENGMNNNAFTTFDYTGFYQNLPSSKLELMMDLEVDRMSGLLIKKEDLLSERQVVAEERRWRVDNNPRGVMQESIFDLSYKKLPYRWPVIGYMQDIQNYESEKLRYFYNGFYGPNNAVLVLVGDFKTDEAKKLIEKYYSNLPQRKVPEDKQYVEPIQTKEEFKVIKKDVQNPSVVIAFKTIPTGHDDVYALDLLAQIIGGDSSSRMYNQLIYNKQLCMMAYSYHYALKESSLMMFGAMIQPGQSEEAVRIEIDKIIQDVQKGKIDIIELNRAKARVKKDFVDGLTSMDGKARSLAASEIMTGSYENLKNDLLKYDQVSLSDLSRVANLYLKNNLKNTVVLVPEKNK